VGLNALSKWALGLFGMLTVAVSPAICYEVQVNLPHEDSLFLDIADEDTVLTVKKIVENHTGLPAKHQMILSKDRILDDNETLSETKVSEIWVELLEECYDFEELTPMKTHQGYRKYYTTLTKSEKKDIKFILKTLAKKSLIQLLKYKSQLEYAGDRIDQVHPLVFLSFIFSDEELKAYIHAIKKRGGWVWAEFMEGLKESLKDESDIQNVTDKMLQHFSAQVGINVGIIQEPIRNYQWEEFVRLLIVHIPRDDGSDRYDM